MRIGALALAAGVSVDTLRYYEKIGLLKGVKRLQSGQRSYGPNELATLQFIRRAQLMNFSLKEIAELLVLRRDSSHSQSRAQAIIHQKLAILDGQIEQLQLLRQELSAMVERCEGRDNADDCPIIDGFEQLK
ncbi:HTH-type transcriptional regulator HmrR [Sinobacterium norvegicum]|uniref:HTH-type transcriptional regulator HmrR n=1 Tax=Sinobacterium norvegicum TaxID=1641715 RepID=A0ABM9AIA6_9GAMM|nr:heavy metal-responsive transcriptional regulator [Sinobacterium norvegicum]CAH0992946.1 HTH-type transcriptional regulator HmrR [Sinobacterium norvegicum]